MKNECGAFGSTYISVRFKSWRWLDGDIARVNG
jgi:hypothetical protein